MSTSVGQPTAESSWKQEVSRRIALHQSRKGLSAVNPAQPAQSWTVAGSHAAQAAARVAARYAQAPSFSEMQAADARAALRAAEKATHAALEANAAAQAALAGLDVDVCGKTAPTRSWKPEAAQAEASAWPAAREWEPHFSSAQLVSPPAQMVAPDSLEAWESELSHNHWEPDIRLLPLHPAVAPPPSAEESFASAGEDEWERTALPASFAPPFPREPWESSGDEAIEAVEAELPIHANLIQFPRELVATRKMRPRRIEGPYSAEHQERQLSIFEVDPDAISTEPEVTGLEPAPAWIEPDWSGIELAPQAHFESEPQYASEPPLDLRLAPIGCRIRAALVDGALIAAVCLGAALAISAGFTHLPPAKYVQLGAGSAFILIGTIYQAFFLLLIETTPGMRAAGISLCTFDGQIPTRRQLRSRLGALLLSLVPVGLGIAWVLFDEDHLSWHDRLSRTYLREC